MLSREYLQQIARESIPVLRESALKEICEEAKAGVLAAAHKGDYAFVINIPKILEENCTYEEIIAELKPLFPDCKVGAGSGINGTPARIFIAWN